MPDLTPVLTKFIVRGPTGITVYEYKIGATTDDTVTVEVTHKSFLLCRDDTLQVRRR